MKDLAAGRDELGMKNDFCPRAAWFRDGELLDE
jgi:hypothetical protein